MYNEKCARSFGTLSWRRLFPTHSCTTLDPPFRNANICEGPDTVIDSYPHIPCTQSQPKTQIFERGAQPTVLIDAHGIISMYNERCVSEFGYSKEEAIGKNVSMLMPESYAKMHDAYMRRYLETGEVCVRAGGCVGGCACVYLCMYLCVCGGGGARRPLNLSKCLH